MARNRRPGELPDLPTRGPTETPLGLLLRAHRFRVTSGGERVAANLLAHGAQVSADAAAWIGAGTPPPDAPSLSLGVGAGTLGPRSYGFFNNTSGAGPVVALDLPALDALPRRGRLGVIVPSRESLPDLLPLFCARELPVAWLISVGDGDPGEAIAFLNADDDTDAIAIALGGEPRAAGLRATLGAKPTVLLGGDPIARAIARGAGAHVVERIGEWLALGALLGAGATLADPVELWVAGGGVEWLRREAQRYAVNAPLTMLDERDPQALTNALAAAVPPRLIVLVGASSTPLPAKEGVRVLVADTRQPEQVSRLLKALGAELQRFGTGEAASASVEASPVDVELAERVRAECEGVLLDHDMKRLLKAWGIKVTRQGPTGTPTGAVKLAHLLGLPTLLIRGDDERRAETFPEVRRLAALLLESESDAPRSVMVREPFPDAPRTRVRVVQERGVGLMMKVGDAVALLPLDPAEAARLAQHSGARRAADQKTVAQVLSQIGMMALTESSTLELDLFTGSEPVVLRSSGALKR
jgi:hypothetical protein